MAPDPLKLSITSPGVFGMRPEPLSKTVFEGPILAIFPMESDSALRSGVRQGLRAFRAAEARF